MKTNKVVVVDGVRTPFGRFCGKLKDIDYYDLGALPLREVMARNQLPRRVVQEIFFGIGDTSVCKDVYTPLAARQCMLHAGFPETTISLSIDRACVSGSSAIRYGFRLIRLGDIDCAIGGGATSFSRTPLILRGVRTKVGILGDSKVEDPLYKLGYKEYASMVDQIDGLAYEHGITREEQDDWAFKSHNNYMKAYSKGIFRSEMMPIPELDVDEQFRPTTSYEKLSELKTAYGSRTITAGNAPGLNDGAAAVLIMTEEKAKDLGLEPIAEIIDMTSIAINPNRTAEAPGLAIMDILKRTNMNLNDISVMEINEAFAAVVLVSIKVLVDSDRAKMEEVKKITNVNGSAIAIGHANTASGARMLMNLAYEIQRRGQGYALGSIGGALGLGDAFILKAYEG